MNDSRTVLITGGIGDFLALLNHSANLPEKVLLATPRAGELAEIADLLGIAVRVIEAKRVYHSRAEVQCAHGTRDSELNACHDWSISARFMEILGGQVQFSGNALERLHLPKWCAGDYVVCQPTSLNYQDGRNFTAEECAAVLAATPYRVILLGLGTHNFPKHDRVLDLMNKTSVTEAASCLAHAKACYAVDSWIGNTACVMGMPTSIKSVNSQYYFARRVYQGPNFEAYETCPLMFPRRCR